MSGPPDTPSSGRPGRQPLARGDSADADAHRAEWAAHVAAGRIGAGPSPAPPGFDRMQALDRLFGIGRVGRW